MAYLPDYDTTQYDRKTVEGEPLPQGIYQGIAVKAAQRETKNKDGVYVEVEFDITWPNEFRNRKFWDRFNVMNKNDVAQRIGVEGLTDLAKACGIRILNDDQQLLHKEVILEIGLEHSKDPQFPKPKNKCKKYWPLGTDIDAAKKAARAGGAAPAPIGQSASAPSPAKPNWGNAGTPPVAAASVAQPAAAPQQVAANNPGAYIPPQPQPHVAAPIAPAHPAHHQHPQQPAAAPVQVTPQNAAAGAFSPSNASPWRRPA